MATHLTLYLTLLLIVSFIAAFHVRKESKNRKKAKLVLSQSPEPEMENSPDSLKSTSFHTPKGSHTDHDIMSDMVKFEKEWKWYTPFKKWFKSVQQKRKVYLSLLPHLFDQAV